MISKEKRDLYRRQFSEAWYEEMSQKYKMDSYTWDVEQFRFQEKQVTGNYDFMINIDGGDTETLSMAYTACLSFLK